MSGTTSPHVTRRGFFGTAVAAATGAAAGGVASGAYFHHRARQQAAEFLSGQFFADPTFDFTTRIALGSCYYTEKLRATKQHVVLFQRIFIVGSTEEAKNLRPVMEAQRNAGLDVKFVCASSVPADQRADFIVVDSSVAGELVLSEQRQFKNAVFYSTNYRADDFDKRFNNLWVGARPPSDIDKVPCGKAPQK